jgi:hypothetical protein
LNAGRSPGLQPVGFQGVGRLLHNPYCRPRAGSRTVVRSCRHPTRSGSTEDCPCPKSACPPGAFLPALEKGAQHAGDHRRRPPQGPPTPPPRWTSTANCSTVSASPPPWTAIRPCGYGRSAGHSAAGRWRAPTGLAGRWLSGWSATASRWWTCRPSWPRGCGSYRLGMAARVTPMMRSQWRSPPTTRPPCGRSGSRTRRRCCIC